jgi:hypothetical protein
MDFLLILNNLTLVPFNLIGTVDDLDLINILCGRLSIYDMGVGGLWIDF